MISIISIGTAVAVGIVTMILVGTVVKGALGLRSAVNWFVQTAVLYGVASLAFFNGPQALILITLPTVIHLMKFLLTKWIEYRALNGHYGEEAKWAAELFEENDEQFIFANSVLPSSEVTEIEIIADSKEELRNLMVERYNELASEQLSDSGGN